MTASAVVGPAAMDAMQRRLWAEQDGPAVADALFPPGMDIAIAIVVVVSGRWSEWIDNKRRHGGPERLAAARKLAGQDPPVVAHWRAVPTRVGDVQRGIGTDPRFGFSYEDGTG